ncbi:YtxH domain-containing protein [Streptomyces carpinensis]|uniref:YtxH domain-containing protein n=1 Tax=Streptomyces carpinensis TaxID=66369 RepID=A0ABV1W5J3_9ACTN|nr:YtxH domain-containing protein [Streptomyces carpinensis]
MPRRSGAGDVGSWASGEARAWLILALGVVTTGFGVAFAAAAADDHGRISLPNQEISGVLTALGGGIVGAVVSIMVARASDRETLQHMTEVLEDSLTSTLRSHNERLAPVRQLWHHYYVTKLRGQYVWRYERYPLHLSAHVGSLAVEIDVQSDSGHTHKYLVEAFVRHERLTIVSHKAGEEVNVFEEVYPQFDGELSEYFGLGVVRTWDATNIVTKAILSRLPLVSGTEGTLPEGDFAELDRIWELGFKRLNEVLPDCA